MSQDRILLCLIEVELRPNDQWRRILPRWAAAVRRTAGDRVCKVTVAEGRTQPDTERPAGDTRWYCPSCVAICPSEMEKQLHERLHGHTMEMPTP